MSRKEYLKKIINFYYEKKKSIPGLEWIQKRMKTKIDISIEEIEQLIEDLIKEKFIKKAGNKLFLCNNSLDENDKIKENQSIDSFMDNSRKLLSKFITFDNRMIEKEEMKFHINSKWVDILRLILLIIGLGAVYMSIYYSYIWLLDFLSSSRALLLAIIMICFAVISFELIIFFKRLRKYFLVGIFSVMWIIVTFFSMISTVAGQYNSRMETIQKRYENQKNIESANREYTEYMEQKRELQDALKILKQEYTMYQSLLLSYTPDRIEQNENDYKTLQWRRNKVYGEMQTLLSLLQKLRKKKDMRKVINKSVPDFYLWMGELWKWQPEKIQFWLSIFPAVFIDILAPLSFAVVIFAGRKK